MQWNWAQQVQPFMPLDVAPRLNALNTIVQKPLEETAELVNQAGGRGIAVVVDHLDPEQVQALVARVEREQGLDVLVNDMGAEYLVELNKPLWGFLDRGCGCCCWRSIPTSSPATLRCSCSRNQVD